MQALHAGNTSLFLLAGGCCKKTARTLTDKATRRFETRHGSQSELSEVLKDLC